MTEIENGCTQLEDNLWETSFMYVGEDKRDQVKFISYVFVTANGEVPEIGDFIENGRLVKRTTPKVNSDWSRWKDKDLYGNP